VSSFQKVAAFKIVGRQKQGGNVASYFCTPDGRVLHAIAGPVGADVFLREARWAVEVYKLGQLEAGNDPDLLRAFFHRAHSERLRKEHRLDLDAGVRRAGKLGKQGRVHLLLAAAPLARVEGIYKLVFEKILGEKVSTDPVAVTR